LKTEQKLRIFVKNLGKRSGFLLRLLGIFHRRYLLYLTAFIAVMFFFIIFGGRGLMQVYHLKEERDKIRSANSRLGEENKKLADQIERMKHNKKEEVEKIAREELGLVKKGEVVYQFER
jgi:cell division protein FtsB